MPPPRASSKAGGRADTSLEGLLLEALAHICKPQPQGPPAGPSEGPGPEPLLLTWSLNLSSLMSFRLMRTLKYAPNMPVSRALAATCKVTGTGLEDGGAPPVHSHQGPKPGLGSSIWDLSKCLPL